ncbi:hypothetical protein D3C72_2314880 [compost metagenome]
MHGGFVVQMDGFGDGREQGLAHGAGGGVSGPDGRHALRLSHAGRRHDADDRAVVEALSNRLALHPGHDRDDDGVRRQMR